jgi:hypothetical protein
MSDPTSSRSNRDAPRVFTDVGGTKGGFVEFVIGLLLIAVGAWLFFDRVNVWGSHVPAAGPLLGFVVGVAMLFFNGRSLFGWLIVVGALGWMLFAVFSHTSFYFRPTSLKSTLLMLGCVGAGVGLVGRAVRAH